MSAPHAIKAAFERGRSVLSRRPERRPATSITTVRVRDGLRCEVESGPWRLCVDMPVSAGGTDAGPTPGVLARAALGSCLAIGYAMRAAADELPITALEVEIQTDWDQGALYGVGDAVPGYSEVRYLVTVESSAPAEAVYRVLDAADAHSPYLAVFQRPQPCRRSVILHGPAVR